MILKCSLEFFKVLISLRNLIRQNYRRKAIYPLTISKKKICSHLARVGKDKF